MFWFAAEINADSIHNLTFQKFIINIKWPETIEAIDPQTKLKWDQKCIQALKHQWNDDVYLGQGNKNKTLMDSFHYQQQHGVNQTTDGKVWDKERTADGELLPDRSLGGGEGMQGMLCGPS